MPERKSFIAIETKAPDDSPGVVEAIVSVSGNEDLGGDIVQPGAFAKFIGAVKSGAWPKWPMLLWNHGIDLGLAAVTGKVTDMKELPPGSPELPESLRVKGLGGLWIRGQYNLDTQPGREAYAHVKAGDVSDWSFMYEAPDTEIDTKGRRLLKTIFPVYECSNTPIGMNPETMTVGVKSLALLLEQPQEEISDHSKALREQVREIVEQLEGMLNDPEKYYKQGKKFFVIDAETGEKVRDDIEAIEVQEKGSPLPTLTGSQGVHQFMFTQAISAINSLMTQELAEPTAEYDDVQWLASTASSLVSWARQEMASNSTGISPSSSPLLLQSTIPDEVETKSEEKLKEQPTDEVDEKKIAEILELAMRDIFPKLDLSEFIETPEAENVIEESGAIDGLTNWARFRVR